MSSSLPPPFGPDLKVLVLAGSNPVSRRLRRRRAERARHGEREIPLANKAFLPLRGRMVIEYVLDWLRDCGLSDVWVLAAEESLARIPARYRYQPLRQRPGSSLFANLSTAYTTIAPAADEPILVVFGDHPLNSRAALRAFLRGCAERLHEADYFHGFALAPAYAQYAPWFDRTSANLRDMSGRATGMNLAVASRLHRLKVLDDLYAVRKQERLSALLQLLYHLTRWLGWRSLHALADCTCLWIAKEAEKHSRRPGLAGRLARPPFALLRRLVPARRMEAYLAKILEAERGVRLIPLNHGGIAIDVDFAEELRCLEADWDEIHAVAASQDTALEKDAGPHQAR